MEGLQLLTLLGSLLDRDDGLLCRWVDGLELLAIYTFHELVVDEP